MGSSMRLFCHSRPIERAYSLNRYRQCRNCCGFGHVTPRCPSADSVCPLCSLNYLRSNHCCPNPPCPSSGNLKATPSYWAALPASCVNFGGKHTALFKECPSHLARRALWGCAPHGGDIGPPPIGDAIDTATDDDNLVPPTSATHWLPSAFEVEILRAMRTTMIPAFPWPAHKAGGGHAAEGSSPSPIPNRNPGMAHECSTSDHHARMSRLLCPCPDRSHSFKTTASGAGMCFFPCLVLDSNWPLPTRLLPFKTPWFTGASYPSSNYTRAFRHQGLSPRSPVLLLMFLVFFFPLSPFCQSLSGEMR